MTVELVFSGGVPIATVDAALHPSGGGVGVDVSAESATINRHDVTIRKLGRTIIIHVDVSGDLSDATEQAIIDAVPASHIQTRSARAQ